MLRWIPFTLVLFCLPSPAQSQESQKPSAPKRENLRYDGKPFSYWARYPLTELKAENRIDAIRALTEFGKRGYAKEASQVLVEILKDQRASAFVAANPLTPNHKVVAELRLAIRELGTPAFEVMIENLDSASVRSASPYSDDIDRKTFPTNRIPALMKWISGTDTEAGYIALRILKGAVFQDEKAKAIFLKAVMNEKKPAPLVKGLINALKQRKGYNAAPLLGLIGLPARAAIPELVIAVVRGSEEAQQALEKMKPTVEELKLALVHFIHTDPEHRYLRIAVKRLGKLGPKAKDALPVILKLLKQPYPREQILKTHTVGGPLEREAEFVELRVALLTTYEKLGGSKAQLSQIIADWIKQSKSFQLQEHAVRSLPRLVSDPAKQVSLLKPILASAITDFPGEIVRRRAEGGISFIEVTDQASRDASCRVVSLVMALEQLGSLGPKAKATAPMLVKAFKVFGTDYQPVVLRTLYRVDPGSKATIQLLHKASISDNKRLQETARELLKESLKKTPPKSEEQN